MKNNKTRTSKVGAISKAQKAQSFQKYRRGGLFELFENPDCCKISKKNEGATLRRH